MSDPDLDKHPYSVVREECTRLRAELSSAQRRADGNASAYLEVRRALEECRSALIMYEADDSDEAPKRAGAALARPAPASSELLEAARKLADAAEKHGDDEVTLTPLKLARRREREEAGKR